MSKYVKKPIVIDAIRFTKDNYKECEQFLEGNYDNTLNYPNIKTLEGTMTVSEGDWIIKGIKGEFYPCKPDIFNMTYNPYVETCLKNNPKLIVPKGLEIVIDKHMEPNTWEIRHIPKNSD